MIARRHVKTPIAAPHGFGEQIFFRNVAVSRLKICSGQAAQVAAGPQERLYAVAASSEFVDQIGADKARSACDKAVHNFGSPSLDVMTKSFQNQLALREFGSEGGEKTCADT